MSNHQYIPGYERITDDPIFDGPPREVHEYRYHVAARYTKDSDVVLDAACGSAFGKRILKGEYIGVDRWPDKADIVVDLEIWEPDFEYDVFVSMETIEHLFDYSTHVKNAKKAKRIIAVSAPVVPTVVYNADGTPNLANYHVHNFTMTELKSLFEDNDWEIIHEEIQTLGDHGIIILQKNGKIL